MNTHTSIIETKGLTKQFRQGTKTIHAVHDVTLTVPQGAFAVVIGPSGSGKSTLLQMLGGLDRPTSGSIKIKDIDITDISDAKLTTLRRDSMGFIFQNFNLIPTLTAAQNVEAGIAKRSAHDHKRVTHALKEVGLDQRANHLPSKLSGGEQQRVAIARALVNEPDIIFADEPTGNLDSKTGESIIEILRKLNAESKKTVIVITHADYVARFASEIIEIKDGNVTTREHTVHAGHIAASASNR